MAPRRIRVIISASRIFVCPFTQKPTGQSAIEATHSLQTGEMLNVACVETTGDSVQRLKVGLFSVRVRAPACSILIPIRFHGWTAAVWLSMRNAWTPFAHFTGLALPGATRPPAALLFLLDNLWTLPPMFDLGLRHARSHAQSKQRLHSVAPLPSPLRAFWKKKKKKQKRKKWDLSHIYLFLPTMPLTFTGASTLVSSSSDHRTNFCRYQK